MMFVGCLVILCILAFDYVGSIRDVSAKSKVAENAGFRLLCIATCSIIASLFCGSTLIYFETSTRTLKQQKSDL